MTKWYNVLGIDYFISALKGYQYTSLSQRVKATKRCSTLQLCQRHFQKKFGDAFVCKGV